MEAPDRWSFPCWNDEAAKFEYDERVARDVLLLGRVPDSWPAGVDSGAAVLGAVLVLRRRRTAPVEHPVARRGVRE